MRSMWLLLLVFCGAACADKCSVFHLTATEWDVDCSNHNLTVLPDFSNRPVVFLNARNAQLSSNVSFKNWTHLKYIDISFNAIVDFKPTILDGFVELGSLNASYCSLERISSPQLKSGALIKVLDLSGNDRLPLSLDFLQTLNKSLDRGTANLHINNMNISEIPKNFFVAASSLLRLHMRDNHLSDLPVFPKNLVYLDVSNNSLTHLHNTPFKFCSNLRTLDLQNNNLTEIDDDAFSYLFNLTLLSLSGNEQLDYIPNGLFSHNHNLKKLFMANCNFKTLSSYFEPTFLNLNSLELHGNPWECDPALKWLLSVNETSVSNIRCENGLSLVHYYGRIQKTLLRNIMIVLVFMTFSFFAIGAWYIYDLEKKRKAANPYWRLGRKNVMSNPVYISTVV